MEWKIFYDDGSTFSSEDGPWSAAPADGVLFVVERRDGQVNVLSGNDHYVKLDDAIAATADLGPILRSLGFVKFGRWTSHRTMERVREMVRAECQH